MSQWPASWFRTKVDDVSSPRCCVVRKISWWNINKTKTAPWIMPSSFALFRLPHRTTHRARTKRSIESNQWASRMNALSACLACLSWLNTCTFSFAVTTTTTTIIILLQQHPTIKSGTGTHMSTNGRRQRPTCGAPPQNILSGEIMFTQNMYKKFSWMLQQHTTTDIAHVLDSSHFTYVEIEIHTHTNIHA